MDILSFLQSNNIVIDEESFFNRSTYSKEEELIKKQIDLIVKLQGMLKKQKSTLIPRIESDIGKEVENFKVALRKNVKNIEILKISENITKFDAFIISESTRVIERAQRALESIDNEMYLDLIRRSMRDYELCLGRVDESNIKVEKDGTIKIRTTKYIAYNLIEHDIYNYIKKIKRRGYEGDISIFIQYYMDKSLLTDRSYNYIKALTNYPIDEIKLLNKYFSRNYIKTPYQWIEEMNLAIKNDGKELI